MKSRSFISCYTKKYFPKTKHISNCLLVCILFLSLKADAQGDLLITPRRVIFDGSKKSAEINLANIGKDTASYVISFIQIRMKADGTFEQITEPDSTQYFADKYLRFFPRSVTLAPNEAQSVKVQLIKTNELKDGEYRSHLYFRALPNNKPLGEAEPEPTKSTEISVRLVPVFGISIPIIIRHGEPNSKVALSNLSLQMEKETTPSLKVTFNRTGNMSVYGDLLVDHISAEGKVVQVGMVKGIAVYTPNAERDFQLMLDKNKGVNFHKGKLRVTYSDQSPQPVKMAEKEIVLQ